MKIPTVSISAKPRTLIEDQGTVTKITIASNRKIKGGLEVEIDSDKEFALGDFEIIPSKLGSLIKGGQIVSGNSDNSGFTVKLTSKRAVISLPVFDDDDNPSSGNRNSDIGKEKTTFKIVASSDYKINSKRDDITLTFLDSKGKGKLVALNDGLDGDFNSISENNTLLGSTGNTTLQSSSKTDVITSLEDSGLISIESDSSLGSNSITQQDSSVGTDLDRGTNIVALTDASTLTTNSSFTIEDI